MTVITYRDGILASDSRESEGKDFIWDDRSKKIYRLSDGSLYGGAGTSSSIEVLRLKLEICITEYELGKTKDKDLPNGVKGVNAILVAKNGGVFFYEKDWTKYRQPFLAIGSGREVAFGAMEQGASAVEAVSIVKKRVMSCGGRTQVLKLKRKKK